MFARNPAGAWAALLFLLTLLLRLVSGFDGLYGQDSYAYLNRAGELTEALRNGGSTPPFFWPEGYPLLGAFLGFVLPLEPGMQLISLLSGAILLYFAIRIAGDLYPEAQFSGPILFMMLGLSPWGLRSSLLVMSDSLAVAALVAGGWWALRYHRTGKLGPLIGAGLTLGWAGVTRYVMVLPALLPLSLLLGAGGRRRDLKFVLFPIAALLPVTAHFLLHTNMAGGPLGHHFLADWSPANWFRRDFEMADGQFHYATPNLVYALGALWHPGLTGLGMLALPLGAWKGSFRQNPFRWSLVPTLLLLLLFLAGIPFQNPRFLLPALPLVALLYLPVWEGFLEKWSDKWWWMAAGTVGAIHLMLAVYVSRVPMRLNVLEKEIAGEMNDWPERRVYTFALDGALRSRCPDLEVINMWDAPLTEARAGELVLFNAPQFEVQWKGKLPMRNWHFLQDKYDLQVRKSFPDGWTLYEIAP
jgi:hypothetical protein